MKFFPRNRELINLIKEKQAEIKEDLKRFPRVKKKLSQLNIEGYEEKIRTKINSFSSLKEIEEILEEITKQREGEEIEELISKTEKLIEGIAFQIKNPSFLAALKVLSGIECPKILQQFSDEEISYSEAKQSILTLREQAKVLASDGTGEGEENYYQILGVPEYASQEEIRSCFTKKITEYHPDRQPPDSKQWVKEKAEEMTKKFNEAYSVLGDPKKRKEYDQKIGIGGS